MTQHSKRATWLFFSPSSPQQDQTVLHQCPPCLLPVAVAATVICRCTQNGMLFGWIVVEKCQFEKCFSLWLLWLPASDTKTSPYCQTLLASKHIREINIMEQLQWKKFHANSKPWDLKGQPQWCTLRPLWLPASDTKIRPYWKIIWKVSYRCKFCIKTWICAETTLDCLKQQGVTSSSILGKNLCIYIQREQNLTPTRSKWLKSHRGGLDWQGNVQLANLKWQTLTDIHQNLTPTSSSNQIIYRSKVLTKKSNKNHRGGLDW